MPSQVVARNLCCLQPLWLRLKRSCACPWLPKTNKPAKAPKPRDAFLFIEPTSRAAGTDQALPCVYDRNGEQLNVTARDPNVSIDVNTVWKLRGYSMIRTLGGGSYSTVRLMQRKEPRDRFALKIIDSKQGGKDRASGENIAMREVEINRLLNHEHLAQATRSYNIRYMIFMEMPLAFGSLLTVLEKRDGKRFPEDEVRIIMQQIGSAIQYLHGVGVVHKDIKPDNVLRYREGHDFVYKVSDFGFAKRIGPDWSDSVCCGTPGYIAPEMYGGDSFDPRLADTFALGILFYGLLVCKLPWLKIPALVWNKAEMVKHMKSIWTEPEVHGVKLSQPCREALSSMTTLDENSRWQMGDFMSCDWLRETGCGDAVEPAKAIPDKKITPGKPMKKVITITETVESVTVKRITSEKVVNGQKIKSDTTITTTTTTVTTKTKTISV